MERIAELILKLLEIQGVGRHRSAELVVEDEQLINNLQKKYEAGQSSLSVKLSQGSRALEQFKD